jgi:hypothetical protein
LFALLTVSIATQVAAESVFARPASAAAPNVLWIRSPQLMRRLTLGFNAVWADVYWIRAVQYYGGTKLSTGDKQNFDLLYPLLDITTSLDPRFNIAYRLGAILLSEAYPNGPGNPDQALALLQKGIREMPNKWQYYHDAGFVEYWWRSDADAAAAWFVKGADLPDSPNWLRPVAASILAERGDRRNARAMWQQLAASSEHDWIRQSAQRALWQLDAEEHIEILQPVVNEFYERNRRFPNTWLELVRDGRLRRIPADPTGTTYALDPESGAVDVARVSSLFPLRRSSPAPVSPR